MDTPNIISASGELKARILETHPELAEEPNLPSEEPTQDPAVPKWEYKERKDPKWGTVTKEGLIVGRGAKQRIVPPDEVWKLAEIGCTDREIATWFMVDENTLRYNFSDYLAKGRMALHRRLRAMQIKTALSGNATLLIWLGKQYLGQSDTPYNSDDNKPLPWNDEV